MARPEASVWDYLRGLLPTGIHYSRIESETCPGFPDIHYTLEGVSATIELKSGKFNSTYPFSGKSGLRKSQILWMRDELEAGGMVLLALEVKPYYFLLNAECYYEDLHKMSFEEVRRVSTLFWEKGNDVRDRLAVALVNKS